MGFRAIVEACRPMGLTPKCFAMSAGKKESTGRRWAKGQTSPSFSDIERMAEELPVAAVTYLANRLFGKRGVFLPNDLKEAADLRLRDARQHSLKTSGIAVEFARYLDEALADGSISREEHDILMRLHIEFKMSANSSMAIVQHNVADRKRA